LALDWFREPLMVEMRCGGVDEWTREGKLKSFY